MKIRRKAKKAISRNLQYPYVGVFFLNLQKIHKICEGKFFLELFVKMRRTMIIATMKVNIILKINKGNHLSLLLEA